MADKNTHAKGLRYHDTDVGCVRLLVVDRHPAARRGLKMRLALEEDLEVVGEEGDATEAIPLAAIRGAARRGARRGALPGTAHRREGRGAGPKPGVGNRRHSGRMLRWIDANGYRPVGYIREPYIELGEDRDAWATELQEPVAR